MKLYDYLISNEVQNSDEITVWDTDYDLEVYFYKPEENPDIWDKAKIKLAQNLEIDEILRDQTVIVYLSKLIEDHLKDLKKADLFISYDLDDIMDDLPNILAGDVSEEWFEKFVSVLNGEE